jgi:hypothetical protein
MPTTRRDDFVEIRPSPNEKKQTFDVISIRMELNIGMVVKDDETGVFLSIVSSAASHLAFPVAGAIATAQGCHQPRRSASDAFSNSSVH